MLLGLNYKITHNVLHTKLKNKSISNHCLCSTDLKFVLFAGRKLSSKNLIFRSFSTIIVRFRLGIGNIFKSNFSNNPNRIFKTMLIVKNQFLPFLITNPVVESIEKHILF